MEVAQRPTLAVLLRSQLADLASESRNFWTRGRVHLALAIFVGMLVLEVVVAAAFYAGADGQFGRAPMTVHRVASFLGLNAPWAKAIFRATEIIEVPMITHELNLRQPHLLASNLLTDVAGITTMWLLPIFAAIAFTSPYSPRRGAAATLVFRSVTALGPLALVALSLSAISVALRVVLPPFFASPADPSLYPIHRFIQADWESVWRQLTVSGPWIIVWFVLVSAVAALWQDRQQALAASIGTPFFAVPLLEMAAARFYPGGIEAIPTFLVMYGDPLIKMTLFALVLPFALRTLRSRDDHTADSA